MKRLLTSGLLALMAGYSQMVRTASSQEVVPPIATQTFLEQRIEQLPAGPICWDVRRGSLAPGASSPATGYHTHAWVVNYVTDGLERLVYADGRELFVGPGEAVLVEADLPHLHESIGTAPRANFNFELTCVRQPNSLATTGPLPGIRSGSVSYLVQARLRRWTPGAQTPVHVLSGPTSTYVLEGTIRRSTAGGEACTGAGGLYVSPVGVVAQNTALGGAASRTLDVDLWPVAEARSVAQPAAVQALGQWLRPFLPVQCPTSP